MKLEVFILGGQRIDQKERRDSGEAKGKKGRRERIGKGIRERIEIERIETKVPQGTVVLLRRHEFQQDSEVKYCSSEVLVFSRVAW